MEGIYRGQRSGKTIYLEGGRAHDAARETRAPGTRLMPLIVVIALFFSVPAYAQSDETCVAYLEADAAYEPARRKYRSALAAADKATADSKAAWEAVTYAEAAYEVRLRNASNPTYAGLHDLTDHESAKRDLEIALDKARAASAAMRKAWDIFAATASATEPARKKKSWDYLAAYKGPTSIVGCGPKRCGPESVMAKLINADRERCRIRLE